MSNLSNKRFISLVRSAHKILFENAEAQRQVAAMDHAERLRDLEWQSVLDEVLQIASNGSLSAESRVDAIADIIFALYPNPNDPEIEGREKIDGQTQVRYGQGSDIDLKPAT